MPLDFPKPWETCLTLMGESQLFLDKARESLASAHADFAAGRFNSCANRAYYAAFQAAIAALIHAGVQGREDIWSHRFVMSECSSTLVRRIHLLPSSLSSALNALMEKRNVADYESRSVSKQESRRSLRRAGEIVSAVRVCWESEAWLHSEGKDHPLPITSKNSKTWFERAFRRRSSRPVE